MLPSKLMERAVLFIIFNRLEATKRVFEEIRKAKPAKLYIASDGARENIENEKEIVEDVRTYVLNNIDWECKVKTKFNNKNQGCAIGISGALNWFFEYEKDGIILEDDCIPNESFFQYCEDLLDYYKENKNIWHISGYNFLALPKLKESYYFSSVPQVWGWATWADRWKRFEFDLSDYDANNIKRITSNKVFQSYWLDILKSTKENKVDSWAYRWFFTMLKYNGVAIIPKENLIENIGNIGTHFNCESPIFFTKTYKINKLIHPKKIKIKKAIMDKMFREWYFIDDRPTLVRKIQLFIKKKEWKKLLCWKK